MGRRKVDLQTAAEILSISSDAVRKRAKRGKMPYESGTDGKLYVWVDTGETEDLPPGDQDDRDQPDKATAQTELVESLLEQVRYMREQLEAERNAHAETRRIAYTLVSDLLVDPERIRSGMERLIEQERATHVGDPEREAEAWARKIADCDRRRSAYQDQQAAGLMTLEELGARLKELESIRASAEREFATIKDRRRRVEELEEDRDALLESLADILPEALDDLTGEERGRIYQMLRLEAMPVPQGGYEVSGALCTFGAPRV